MKERLCSRCGGGGVLAPAMVHETYAVAEIGADHILLANGKRLDVSPQLAGEIAGAENIVVAAATLGPALEARIAALFAERQALRALTLEELATAALFELSDQVSACIVRMARKLGHGASDRYAPGDDGVPFALQPVLCELAGAGRLGIGLSGSGMMRPVKSLCFLFATGKGLAGRKPVRSCQTCRARERCRYRAAPPRGIAA